VKIAEIYTFYSVNSSSYFINVHYCLRKCLFILTPVPASLFFDIKNRIIFTVFPVFPIRLNGAPVRGFQRDAGSRTTIRLVYPEAAPASPDEYRDTAVLALVVFKSLDLDWLTSVVTKRPLVRDKNTDIQNRQQTK